jgi:hypothetical protein
VRRAWWHSHLRNHDYPSRSNTCVFVHSVTPPSGDHLQRGGVGR